MTQTIRTDTALADYKTQMELEEKAPATIEKYLRDVQTFLSFLPEGGELTRETVLQYKRSLEKTHRAASTNSMLAALNSFLAFLHREDCRVQLLKIQRPCFRDSERELTKQEYERLVQAAKSKKNERLYLLLQTICSTGIRVSEHRFITAEALSAGPIRVMNKGRERTIFLPDELRGVLAQYCKRKGIASGPVFVTRTGKPLNRCNIWSEMKTLCRSAGVDDRKVYPHNLRHLFAVTYYRMEKDIVHLADILGHASVETTRSYTATCSDECARALSRMKLLLC